MKKQLTTLILFTLISWGLQAQLKLNVEGDAAISGKLGIGTNTSPTESFQINGFTSGINESYLKIATAGENVGVQGDRFSGIKFRHFSDAFGMTIESVEGQSQTRGLYFKRHLNDVNGETAMFISRENGFVGLGTTEPNFKLHVFGPFQTAIGLTNTSAGGKGYGLYSTGESNSEGAGNFMIRDETAGENRFFITPDGKTGIGTITPGDKLQVINQESTIGTAISGFNNAPGDQQHIGIFGGVVGSDNYVGSGVVGQVNGTGTGDQYGVFGWIVGENAGNRYAIYGLPGGTGVGTQYAGYFVGDVTVTGTFDNSSDQKLKKNIKTLDKALDRVMKLEPVRYDYRSREYPQMNLAEGPQMGFIAQEVEIVFPELVKDNFHPETPKSVDENGYPKDYYPAVDYKGLNYIGLIPVLTKATQEQQEEIEANERDIADLRAENERLREELDEIKELLNQVLDKENNNTNLNLGVGSLLQNQPNPFREATLITYAVPEGAGNAELQITDMSGRVIKRADITTRGEGTFTLRANSLPAGTYAYSLIVDGELVETKKMVLTK